MDEHLPRSFEEQVELLGSRDRHVRHAAERALDHAGQAALNAVIAGLAHQDGLVRRHCAAFLDHHADNACIPALRALVHDAVPRVRREAVHSIICQRCKPAPLELDVVPILIERALSDDTLSVRRFAVAGLMTQPRDARVIAALRTVLERETDRLLRKHAHRALRLQDPAYRATTDEQAKTRDHRRHQPSPGDA